jgi:hypothetical protein
MSWAKKSPWNERTSLTGQRGRSQIRSTCLRVAASAEAGEIRNPEWFDQLTTLSHVEGQIRITKIQEIER